MHRCRKNQATLSSTEKANFVAAVHELKRIGKYDQYVQDHMNFMQAAHRGPAFFPWHREFLNRFEQDLQAINQSVTLPYWNWTVDNSPTSSIWNTDFMGGNGRPTDGQVMTEPFAFITGNWPLNVEDGFAFGFLRRRFGLAASAPTLPSIADLNTPGTGALNVTPYDVAPFNDGISTAGFRNRIEGFFSGWPQAQLHNRVHMWVGGSMLPGSSPNDPVFFLHHCFVDKLWADWQRLHPTEGYLPVSPIAGKPGHSLNEAMQPWAGLGQNVTPANVLDHHALGYAYDTEGVCLPTLKFIDDRPDLGAVIKALRDGQATLKFSDDAKLKFTDDVGTFKFLEDIITLKFSDDVGTSPRIDPIKQPGLDKSPLADAAEQPGLDQAPGADRPGVREAPQEGRLAPFALSTPHHSMAWMQSLSEAHRTTLTQYELAIVEYEQKIREINETFEKGQLSEADRKAAENLFQEYQTLLAEYQQLTQQGQ